LVLATRAQPTQERPAGRAGLVTAQIAHLTGSGEHVGVYRCLPVAAAQG